MIQFSQDEVEELLSVSPKALQFEEGGQTFLLLPNHRLPDGCSPTHVDLLLCPEPREGYSSRLYFSQPVTSKTPRNWNGQNVRIGERNWFAFSWRGPEGRLRPLQLLGLHLGGLR